VAVSAAGIVYVADWFNHRVQMFTTGGTYLGQWGQLGAGNGQFFYPSAIAFDPPGRVLVVDNGNSRVQMFTANGGYLGQWGSEGLGDGQFHDARSIAVSPDGTIYVLESGTNRVQAFGYPPTPAQGSTWGRVKAAYR
jgi:DNA-binding beta-propeller fold protein YncE